MIKTSELYAKIFCALLKHEVNIKMINQGSNELTIIVDAENNNFKIDNINVFKPLIDLTLVGRPNLIKRYIIISFFI